MRQRKQIRLSTHQYSSTAWYFITIKTQDGKMLFGSVQNNEIVLNQTGEIVRQEWSHLETRLAFVKLDEFVIMPNHMHGILKIEGSAQISSTKRPSKLLAGSLGAIIGQFKSRTVKRARRMLDAPDFVIWQRNYYERIIRGDTALCRVRRYIRANPIRWLE